MVDELIEVQEKKHVLDGTKTFCLYSNKEQDELFAMAYDENNVKEESKYYTSGVWFEFDNVKDSNGMVNERKYKKRISFPSEPNERPTQLKLTEHHIFNSKVGDVR